MLRDGTYKQAKDLKLNESLMPLYRRLEHIGTRNYKSKKYEQVFVPALNDWKFTHKIVEARCPEGYCRHHVDFNRFNNSPENLKLLKWNDHSELHAKHITYYGKIWNEKAVKEGTHPFQRKDVREKAMKSGAEILREYNKTEKHRKEASISGRENFSKLWDNPEWIERHKSSWGKRMAEYNKTDKHKQELRRYLDSERGKTIARETVKSNNHERWHIVRNIVKENCELCLNKKGLMPILNHKVVSIKKAGYEDVYDFIVDKYHNFALSAGVFVHNCDACEAQRGLYRDI
jgi:hypothetical protein